MFECHITCNLADAEGAQIVAEELNWSTSQIERDPVLGKGSYFYLTSHEKDFLRLFGRMQSATNVLRLRGIAVVRQKIEAILYDRKML